MFVSRMESKWSGNDCQNTNTLLVKGSERKTWTKGKEVVGGKKKKNTKTFIKKKNWVDFEKKSGV